MWRLWSKNQVNLLHGYSLKEYSGAIQHILQWKQTWLFPKFPQNAKLMMSSRWQPACKVLFSGIEWNVRRSKACLKGREINTLCFHIHTGIPLFFGVRTFVFNRNKTFHEPRWRPGVYARLNLLPCHLEQGITAAPITPRDRWRSRINKRMNKE